LLLGKIAIREELVETLRDLGIAAGTNGFLEHTCHKPVPRLTASLSGAIDGCKEVIRDCDSGLAQSHKYSSW
jgi:hypothetical protein